MLVRVGGSLLPRYLAVPEGHILVAGPTGSGKTNTVKVLIEEFAKRGLRVLVFDWHGEYKSLERYAPGENLSMNVLDVAPRSDPAFVVSLLASVFQLTEPQWYFLQRSLRNAPGALNLSSLIKAVEDETVKDAREYEIKAAVLRRLRLIADSPFGRALDGDRPPYFLFERNASVDLSVLPPNYRVLIALIILKHLYDYVSSMGFSKQPRHVTVIEEAWNVAPPTDFREKPSIGERLVLEARKYGEKIVLTTQNLEGVGPRILRNCGLVLLHSPTYQDLLRLGLPPQAAMAVKFKSKPGLAYAVYQDGRIKKLRFRLSKL